MAEATEPKKKTKPASPEEILKQMRRSQGLPEDDDFPTLFDDDVLDDFQQCLLKLEKRVKEGPGSLSAEEVLEFEAATGRIVEDMHGKLNGEATSAPEAKAAAPATPAAPPAAAAVAAPSPPQPAVTTGVPADPDMPNVIPTSDEEGKAYEGKGGMGMASGTRNTYVIPGMDEMTAEEYQVALQKSVSERQERRRREMRGTIGNRAGHSYLESLGWGGTSANLAAEDEELKGKDFEPRPDLYEA